METTVHLREGMSASLSIQAIKFRAYVTTICTEICSQKVSYRNLLMQNGLLVRMISLEQLINNTYY